MSADSFLSDDFLRQLISVGGVDLLVGITSHNDAGTTERAVRAAEEGLVRDFPRERTVVVNVKTSLGKAASPAVESTLPIRDAIGRGFESLRTLRTITTSSREFSSAGATLRAILAAADLLRAKACAVVSASEQNLTPAWIGSLLQPVYRESFDFVAPLYSRHKFDGLLARNLLYPASRALFGKAMREVRATEFAFSGRLAAHCLTQGQWNNEAMQGAAKLRMAIEALSGSYRCCQTFLGPKAMTSPSAGVVGAIRQTVSGLFWCIESTEHFWLNPREAAEVATTGPAHQLTGEHVHLDRRRLLEMYRSGIAELSQLLGRVVSADICSELVRLAEQDESAFQISNSLWARTVYEFAASYHHAVLHREHLVQILVPIYRGRVVSFLLRHRASSFDDMEADVEDLCQEFERHKPDFIERWKTKGQGGP